MTMLRVATYNIAKGLTTLRGRPRLHDVRAALDLMDADIVFLQEVQDRNERIARRHPEHPRMTQLDFLCAGGYAHRAYGMNAIYPYGHHGNAILSRHRIHTFTNHDISDHALERRGMLHAVAFLGPDVTQEVHLICVHFGLIKRSRMRQASYVVDFVEQEVPPEAPLIIAGDFNDWQRRVDPLLCQRLGVIDVAHDEPASLLAQLLPWRRPVRVARTFPSFVPLLTLDRIYVRGFDVRAVAVPQGPAWARRSDHAPLLAQLELH
jgi:endonuclease/exonuclease/phosphatase family metal-dependent hydrolase